MHIFRLTYSKLFSMDAFFATAAQPEIFYKPIYLYSLVQVGVIICPLIAVDIIGVVITFDGWWNNQLQMTMFEVLVLSSVQTFLILWERFK
jgi:hypothetical protein